MKAINLLVLASMLASPVMALDVHTTKNTGRLMPYQVFELTFQHDNEYADPTWDVTIDVMFTSPGGKRFDVGGFFYGSSKEQKPIVRPHESGMAERATAFWPCDPADVWKARFAPTELGEWQYEYTFTNPAGETASGTGTFTVVKGRVHQRGWLKIDPQNPYRFMFEDGSPFYPLGTQDGYFDSNHNGSALDVKHLEGPFRLDLKGDRAKVPDGAMFVRGPSMNPQNMDVKLRRYREAGINLWRFSPNNFSIKVFAEAGDETKSTLDHVRWEQARMVDELLQINRAYGLINFYGIFGYTRVSNDDPDNEEEMAKVRRLVKYSVDRWGAYVDIWQFLNEQNASARWYERMIPYLQSIDPYRRPMTTSWERPEIEGIEINAPHWYETEDARLSDLRVVEYSMRNKRYAKPVIFGEQGNKSARFGEEGYYPGLGGVWDAGSATRMRVRLWTALFTEMSFVFWETSGAKDAFFRNIWIGPEERQYMRSMQSFAYSLKGNMGSTWMRLAGPKSMDVRAYQLRGDECIAVYLHHHGCEQCKGLADGDVAGSHRWDHDRGVVEGLIVRVWTPTENFGTGYWYDPATGEILDRFEVTKEHENLLTAPDFTVDLALLITKDGPPDIDGDGLANDVDPDDDNDGVADVDDAWPLESEEWADADGDRIGDNLDADIDADGVGDDKNGNGVPDHEELDYDGDGVLRSGVVPWDAFPLDAKEWADTDKDGVGDNADTDDDGDGYSDEEERAAGTDPLNAIDFPE